MKVKSELLIADLLELTKQITAVVESFQQKPINKLNWKADNDTWSVLECIEHLNLYGNYYLPEIEQRVLNSKTYSKTYFKAGFLGDYFAKSMLPKEKLNKMKTFKDKNPNGSDLDKTTLERFLMQQQKLQNLLEKAKSISLNKTKTSVSITKLIKLKLGDTFRVVIYHNQRHIKQALKTLEAINQ